MHGLHQSKHKEWAEMRRNKTGKEQVLEVVQKIGNSCDSQN